MKKLLIIFLLCIISHACYSQAFDGFVWKDLELQQRIEYITHTVKAAKKLPLQYELSADIKRVFSTIVEGVEGRAPQDIVDYVNSYYKTREDLYTPVVEVLYKYACQYVNEIT